VHGHGCKSGQLLLAPHETATSLKASLTYSICAAVPAGGAVSQEGAGIYQRSGPGSHPLSGYSSNASSLAGMGSIGGSWPLTQSHSLGLNGHSNGLLQHANGGSNPSLATAGSYGGAGSFPGSHGGSPKAAFGSLGGFGPAGSGPLYKSESLGSLAAANPAPGSRVASSAGGSMAGPGGLGSDAGAAAAGAGSRPGTSAGGGGMLGGFNSAPLAGVAGESG
jgi:hypothetical protein